MLYYDNLDSLTTLTIPAFERDIPTAATSKETETVQASGSDGIRAFADAEVDATSYQRVRVEFERVQASLSGNLSIGGSLLGASLTVDTGSDGKIAVSL